MKIVNQIQIPRRRFLGDLVLFFTATSAASFFKSCSIYQSIPGRLMTPKFDEIRCQGDLRVRAQMSFDRLHDPLFQYPNIAQHTRNDPYPGDFIGRIILGLVQLGQVLGKEPVYLAEIIQGLQNELLNPQGYLGKVQKNGAFDEIQISGHQFFLRGLCDYYQWKPDPAIQQIIERTIRNLLIPLAQEIESYPLGEQRKNLKAGNEIAMDAGRVGNWQLSTDTCQIFMVLDGMTHAAQLFPAPELKNAIKKLIRFYVQINLIEIQAQTHAMLSALRGILRYSEMTGDTQYLDFVKDRFEAYKKHAWTENFENYNWFGRPTHTEGCAIIDSFLLATELWQVTRNAGYLHDAHRIYYNGMLQNQWINGGFGVNSCVGPNQNLFLQHKVEATWCCTMRGSEGLAKAIQYNYFYDTQNIYIPFYHDNRVTLKFDEGDLVLELTSRYPFQGEIELSVVASSLKTGKHFHFFIPEWVDAHTLNVFQAGQEIKYSQNDGFLSFFATPRSQDQYSIRFDIPFYRKAPHHREILSPYFRYFHGPLLLGCASAEEIKLSKNPKFHRINNQAMYQSENGIHLQPLNILEYQDMADQKKRSFQFVFRSE